MRSPSDPGSFRGGGGNREPLPGPPGAAGGLASRPVLLGLLTAAALAANLAESLVPLPLPGAKLGVANAFPLIALLLWGSREATAVMLLRVLLGGLLSGNGLALAASASGATAALAVMIPLRRLFGTELSVPLLSVAGATAYNLAQTGTVAALVGDPRLLLLVPPLALLGIPTGWGVGLLADRAARRLGTRGEEEGREGRGRG